MISITVSRSGRDAALTWEDGELTIADDLHDADRERLRASLERERHLVDLEEPPDDGIWPDLGRRVKVQGLDTAELFMFAIHHLPADGFDLDWSTYVDTEPDQ